jgi:large subunit ribosomal protein L3
MTEETKSAESAEKSADESNKTSAVKLSTFYGVKAGMTRVFNDNGDHVPVTVIKLIPNLVSQVKTVETDGYNAYQVAYGEKREKLGKKPQQKHLAKANISKTLTNFSEVPVQAADASDLGKEVSLEEFTPNTFIDVTGVSKGKGFQGVMKRYNFKGGPAAHGSKFHRTTGAIGNRASPGRVFAEKKMPGHMGDKQVTVQNIQMVEVNLEKGYALLRGSVPGSKNGFVKIAKATKK